MVHGQKIWSGDEWCDKQAGCESVYEAYLRLFGEPFDVKKAIEFEDGGDSMSYKFVNGVVVCFACDGNCIYEAPR